MECECFLFLHCPVKVEASLWTDSVRQSNHLLLPRTILHYIGLITKPLHLSWPSHSSSLISSCVLPSFCDIIAKSLFHLYFSLPVWHFPLVYICIATVDFAICILLVIIESKNFSFGPIFVFQST